MVYKVLSDIVVVIHLVFILFVCLGALLVFKWPRTIWIHLPCVIWGAVTEFFQLICPLTPLENYLRKLSGVPVYHTGFIDHYIIPVIYPTALTPDLQLLLGAVVVVVNLIFYSLLFIKRKGKP